MSGPAQVTERYEALRAAVLGGAGQGWRHAWSVLARSGMAAWVAAVCVIPVPSLPPGTPQDPAGPAPGGALSAQLVAALAGMVMAHPRLTPT